jgi:hypothetical protein
MGDSKKTEKIKQIPGPGNYNPNDSVTKKNTSKNWRFFLYIIFILIIV